MTESAPIRPEETARVRAVQDKRADGFLKQSSDFVSLEGGDLRWGYVGQHSDLLRDGVKV